MKIIKKLLLSVFITCILFNIPIKANNLILILDKSDYTIGDSITLTARLFSEESNPLKFFTSNDSIELEQTEVQPTSSNPVQVSVKGKVKKSGKVSVGVSSDEYQASIPLTIKENTSLESQTLLKLDLSSVEVTNSVIKTNEDLTIISPKEFLEIPVDFVKSTLTIEDKSVNVLLKVNDLGRIYIIATKNSKEEINFIYKVERSDNTISYENVQKIGKELTKPITLNIRKDSEQKESIELLQMNNKWFTTYKRDGFNLIQLPDGFYKYNLDKNLFEFYEKEIIFYYDEPLPNDVEKFDVSPKNEEVVANQSNSWINDTTVFWLLIGTNTLTVTLLIIVLFTKRNHNAKTNKEIESNEVAENEMIVNNPQNYIDEEEINKLDKNCIESIDFPKFKNNNEE